MKKAILAVACALSLTGCHSVESSTVSSTEIAANGEAVAVVQANAFGFTAFLHNIDIVQSDLDVVVNKLLIAEAKAMGASKVDLKSAHTTPRDGIYSLPALILGFPTSEATGIAVK